MKNQSKKIFFLENVRILLENVFNSFKNNVFPTENSAPNLTPDQPVFYTPKLTTNRSKISKVEIFQFKLNENFVIEIRNNKENINIEIFREYVAYQNLSLLRQIYIKPIR